MKKYIRTSTETEYIDPEVLHILKRICDKDVWVALLREGLYTVWVRSYSNGEGMLYNSVHNSAWYPEDYFRDTKLNDRLDAREIQLSDCELRKPVETLSTEELIPYICSEDDRYRFEST